MTQPHPQPHPQRCLHSKMCVWNKGRPGECLDTDCASHRYVYASHSSATEPAKGVLCLTCFHCHKQVSTYHKGLVFRGTAICPECTDKYGESDAAIAQAEREKVLALIATYLSYHGVEERIVGGDRFYEIEGTFSLADFITYIASLRSGGK